MEEDKKPQVGRPLLFKDKETLESMISEYFDSCMENKWFDEIDRDDEGNKKKDEKGKNIYKHIQKKVFVKPISITGLAIFLNTSRETLINYEEKEEFFDTIKKAKDFCHNFVEDGLLNGKINPAAGIFNLKNNYNWKDKTETDFTSKGEKINGFNFVSRQENDTNDNSDN